MNSSLITHLPRRRDVPHRSIGRELMVRDPERKVVHFLNPTATVVWECCNGTTTPAECEERIRGSFSVPAEADVRADILAVLEDLRGKHLLESA